MPSPKMASNSLDAFNAVLVANDGDGTTNPSTKDVSAIRIASVADKIFILMYLKM